jgi:hypothetical protein
MWQGNDIVSVIFDPFYDHRNSIAFTINPLGGRSDGTVTNQRQYSSDWNPVWSLKTGRFEGGWTVEAAYPFKSLRYGPGREQVWGFNLMRVKRSKNEISAITKVPPARGQSAVQEAAYTATVVGLEAPIGGRALDFKPYVTSNVTTDRATGISNDPGGDIGFDGKYSITRNLTTDFTYNTDFAQVEVDEQQVNLTRFSLFFPEKRDFFLENQGTFAFGGVAVNNTFQVADAPILFYSRRSNGPDRRRRAPDGTSGTLQPRRREPADRRRGDHRDAVDQFLGRPCEARHPAQEQRRPDRDESIGRVVQRGQQSGLRRGRDVHVLRERADQYLLGENSHRGPPRERSQLSRAARLPRRSIRAPARTPGHRRRLQPGGRVRAAQRHGP